MGKKQIKDDYTFADSVDSALRTASINDFSINDDKIVQSLYERYSDEWLEGINANDFSSLTTEEQIAFIAYLKEAGHSLKKFHICSHCEEIDEVDEEGQ